MGCLSDYSTRTEYQHCQSCLHFAMMSNRLIMMFPQGILASSSRSSHFPSLRLSQLGLIMSCMVRVTLRYTSTTAATGDDASSHHRTKSSQYKREGEKVKTFPPPSQPQLSNEQYTPRKTPKQGPKAQRYTNYSRSGKRQLH